ncbi:uncharacterized protein LOC111385210 [Olea europaea var. sylvestris]|uniref:uncharacterized protein LOC111385210 n=1 Tax=Olea europaea var. sylvestris TaxID=158386 RepID=UPI000C1D13AF|nr:uncharacterized protein LOC111385210 [Olea europaea var. sylvestris]
MERNNPSTNREGGLLPRSESSRSPATTSSDLFLQWGNRKRLRCMKVQAKDHSNNDSAGSVLVNRTTARVDRRVIRSDSNSNHQNNKNATAITSTKSNGYLNLRQRPASPSHHRILRYSNLMLCNENHDGLVVDGMIESEILWRLGFGLFVQLVSPGTWLCDLTLERYEVREKKVSKKRPRGLKAMGNMESDSE